MAQAGLRKLLGVEVRREEWARLLPLSLAYGLVMASLYVLKPARNALFLDRLGIAQLPYVLLLVALAGGVAALVFARFSARVRLDRLVLGTFLVLMACLGGFWLLLSLNQPWVFYLFYIWVNLYGLLATSLLWLLAGTLFDARQARRLFGLIGTAGILGAVLGGLATSWIVHRVGTEALLLVCVGLLALCLGLLYLVRPEPGPRRRRAPGPGALEAIAGSQLLLLIGGMAGLSAVVAAVVDVQFNQIADQAFPTKDAKAAFFGEFFAYLSLLAFLVQVFLTPRILRSLGVTPALLFLPLSMGLGAGGMLVLSGLPAGVLAKLGDGGLRHSIHKAATEILFLPVPFQVKQRTKLLLDTTVDNVATGLGALLVLICTGALGLGYAQLSWISLGLVALWVGLTLRSRRAYVDAFRQALEWRELDPGEFTVSLAEAEALRSLMAVLDSSNERRVGYALEMLATVRARRLGPPVERLLQHPSAELRLRALRVFHSQDNVPRAAVEALLADGDLQVRIAALWCLCLHEGQAGQRRRLAAALDSPDPSLRSAALGCVAEYGSAAEKELVSPERIEALMGGNREERVQAARLAGARPGLRPQLHRLMEDDDPAVVQQAIATAGELADPAYLPWLVAKLADRRQRRTAQLALAACGKGVLPRLGAWLADEEVELARRRQLARAIGEITCQESVELLLARLEDAPAALQYPLIKSLSKLRARDAQLHFDPARIERLLEAALATHYELLQLCRWCRTGTGSLLEQALKEKQEQNLKRIFRLLGLHYPARDMYRAYLGMVHRQSGKRASALEFLENLLDRRLRQRLVPLLEAETPEQAIAHGARLFGWSLGTRQEVVARLLAGPDPWLRVCAAHSLDGEADPGALEQVRRLGADPDPVVRETAALVLRRAAIDRGGANL
ncbi:MAG: HEAT repeat domain-containing protein [Candidatus Latescibacteria bacterium]|nr:HEAT repeat domain-containing protein [Candidatus Latescibacterota bacterium]